MGEFDDSGGAVYNQDALEPDVADAASAVIDSAHDVQALLGLTLVLRGLMRPPCGLLQPAHALRGLFYLLCAI